jgi:putative hydrolase of the HAD superfamily
MNIRATLFDLDSTLYPASLGLQHAIDHRILEYLQQQLGLTREQAQELRRTYYATYGTTLRGLQLHHDGVDAEHFMAYVHDLAFDAFLSSDAELDYLLSRTTGIKAIFTNSPSEHTHAVLRRLGIERHFGQIFDIRFQQFLPKPHIDGYQRALESLGVAGPEAIMVEDMLKNLTTARELGMTTIYIADEQPPPGHPADYVVPDVHAALRIIIDLQQR